jgi:hypothetical protein
MRNAALTPLVLVLALTAGLDAQKPAPLTARTVANAVLEMEGERVQLKDGQFSGKDAEGFPLQLRIMQTALGDLDADGRLEAIIGLTESHGGSGSQVSIQVLTNNNGQPRHVGGAGFSIGDRSVINKLAIDAGVIVVDAIVAGDDDPLCCPSLKKSFRLVMTAGALVEQ